LLSVRRYDLNQVSSRSLDRIADPQNVMLRLRLHRLDASAIPKLPILLLVAASVAA
jgi:hypothetical protein